MVDAGADLFVGHGPHVLRGIELYKGQAGVLQPRRFHLRERDAAAPAQRQLRARTTSDRDAHVNDFNDARYDRDKSGFPADRLIWEAVVAAPKFRGDQLVELALHPITLGFGKSRSVRGRPQFAEGELGQKILGDLVKLSGDMGTKITIRNGIGYVMLPTSSSQ